MTRNPPLAILLAFAFSLVAMPTLLATGVAFAQDPPKKGAAEKDYEFRTFDAANGRVMFYRFRSSTGEGWWLGDNLDSTWSKFEEPAALPKAKYDFSVAGKTFAVVFRFDRTTGTTWRLVDNTWRRVGEPK